MPEQPSRTPIDLRRLTDEQYAALDGTVRSAAVELAGTMIRLGRHVEFLMLTCGWTAEEVERELEGRGSAG